MGSNVHNLELADGAIARWIYQAFNAPSRAQRDVATKTPLEIGIEAVRSDSDAPP